MTFYYETTEQMSLHPLGFAGPCSLKTIRRASVYVFRFHLLSRTKVLLAWGTKILKVFEKGEKLIKNRLSLTEKSPLLPEAVLHGSVVKYLARNPLVLGSSHTGFSESFVDVSLGKTVQSPSLYW